MDQSAVTWRADNDDPDSPARYVGWALAAAGLMALIAVVADVRSDVFLMWLGLVVLVTVVAYLCGWPERHAIVELRLESNRLTAWWVDGRISSHRIEAVSGLTWTTTVDHPWEVSMVLLIDGRRCRTRSSLESKTGRLFRALRAAGVEITFEEPFVFPAIM